jgi:DNA-binding PadR family transcriptional regulator
MSKRSGPDTRPLLRTTDLLILVILSDGPQHGYGIAQEIRTRSRNHVTVRPGDLYRVLYRMDSAGLIEPMPASAREPDADDRRVQYRITPLGRRVARAQAALFSDICASVLPRQVKPGAGV